MLGALRRGCVPDNATDVSLIHRLATDIDLCSLKEKHPLVTRYEAAAAPAVYKPLARLEEDSCIPAEAYFRASQLIKPLHIASESFVGQLEAQVALEKNTRTKIHFPNYLAQLGHSGSYHWPNEYVSSQPLELKNQPSLYGTKRTEHNVQNTYDSIHHPAVPDNPYRYMYNLHREDRAHAKHTGLYINEEEMRRPNPGILTNSEYGRRHQHVFPCERHQMVHSHKSFYRNRGIDAAK